MGTKIGVCIHCKREYKVNPRVKEQQYCNSKACQRVRKTKWQKEKMVKDADYRENQKRCQKQWQKENTGYYKEYRNKHPEYVERNRAMQAMRDMRRKPTKENKNLAKMDSLIKPYYSRKGSIFKLYLGWPENLAKMDALTVKLVPKQQARWYITGG